MTATKPVHIAILMCRVRLKDGQQIPTLVTSQGEPGEDIKLVLGNALLAAMVQYQSTPDNQFAGFGIDEVRLNTIGGGEPEAVAAAPKPKPNGSAPGKRLTRRSQAERKAAESKQKETTT